MLTKLYRNYFEKPENILKNICCDSLIIRIQNPWPCRILPPQNQNDESALFEKQIFSCQQMSMFPSAFISLHIWLFLCLSVCLFVSPFLCVFFILFISAIPRKVIIACSSCSFLCLFLITAHHWLLWDKYNKTSFREWNVNNQVRASQFPFWK